MTSSTTRSPSFEVDGPTAAVKQRLGWFCAHPAAHARFLNMLSLMEHIGSRKIMTSQSERGLSGDTLRLVLEFGTEVERLDRVMENGLEGHEEGRVTRTCSDSGHDATVSSTTIFKVLVIS